jgi:hypothetical protein
MQFLVLHFAEHAVEYLTLVPWPLNMAARISAYRSREMLFCAPQRNVKGGPV